MLPFLGETEVQSDVAIPECAHFHEGSDRILRCLVINKHLKSENLPVHLVSVPHSHLTFFLLIFRDCGSEGQQIGKNVLLDIDQVYFRGGLVIIILEEFEVLTLVVVLLHYFNNSDSD